MIAPRAVTQAFEESAIADSFISVFSGTLEGIGKVISWPLSDVPSSSTTRNTPGYRIPCIESVLSVI